MGSVAACRKVFVTMWHDWKGLNPGFGFRKSHASIVSLPLPQALKSFVFLTTLHQGWKGKDYWKAQSASYLQMCWHQLILQNLAYAKLMWFICAHMYVFVCDITYPESSRCRRRDARHSLNAPHRISLLLVNTTPFLHWVEKYRLCSDQACWARLIEGRLSFGRHWNILRIFTVIRNRKLQPTNFIYSLLDRFG